MNQIKSLDEQYRKVKKMNNKILVLAGPTAVGKTALSIELAKKLNGEIISTDSMQIYKYMDIGSAKITTEEMDGIKHHMIDVTTPDKPFSVVDFKNMAQPIIDDLLSKDKLPILTGGTGLYINALTCNMNFTDATNDEAYRLELEELAKEHGDIYIHNMLKDIDPVSYESIHPNNRKRVIRALEVYKVTNKPFSSFNAGEDFYKSKYDVHYYVLNMDREKLYQRINKRVDIMFEKGLLNECIKLKENGYNSLMQAMQGIGYKEVLMYLENSISLEEATEMIKQGSRNYAKRQLTWFRKDPRAIFLNKDELSDEEIINIITNDIKSNQLLAMEVVILNKQSNNIQDIFLNNARKSKTAVSIYLVNGFQLRGIVKGFDSFTVILDSEGKQMLIYKHSITTITPAKPLPFSDNENIQELQIAVPFSLIFNLFL